MKNEQMANVWKFEPIPNWIRIFHIITVTILTLNTIFKQSPFANQWAVKPWIIAKPLELLYPKKNEYPSFNIT